MKRVLFISYYFPPSGGPGVQRGLKFVRYLREFGWEPTVLTVAPEFAAFPALDASLLHEIPPDLAVHRTKAFNPFDWYAKISGKKGTQAVTVGKLHAASSPQEALMQWLRANLFVPDARVGWNRYALKKGLQLLKEQRFEAIITTSPPHSTHLIGRALHRKTGVAWLADFRDPWTDISYYPSLPHLRLVRQWDAALERSVLSEASFVTVVSPYYLAKMQAKLAPPAQSKFRLLWNGFDEEDLLPPLLASPLSPTFDLVYAGSLFIPPTGLWEALAALRPELPKLRLKFTGRIDPQILEAIALYGLEDIFSQSAYVPHAEAIARMRAAAVLLLVIEDTPGTQGILTGKIFEYMATGRPILGIGPRDGDAAALLKQTQTGQLFAHGAVEGIKNFLRAEYQAWEQVSLPPLDAIYARLQPFTRRALTATLADLLNEMTPKTV